MADKIVVYNQGWVKTSGIDPKDFTLCFCKDSIGEWGGIPHSHYGLIPTKELGRYGAKVVPQK